jgi:multiple sugar transport system permease protein
MKASGWTKFFLVAPCLLFLVVVIGYPFVFTTYISFTAWDTIAPLSKKFVGLANYARLLRNPSFFSIVKNTIFFVAGTITIEFLVAFALALVLSDKRFAAKSYFLTLLIIPIAISPVVTGQLWRFLYEPSVGPINTFLKFIGIAKPPLWLASARLAMPSLLFAHAWQWSPFMMLLLYSGLQTIPEEIYEAARLDGVSGIKMLAYMTLPLSRDFIAIALMLSTIISFKVFDLIFLTTYGGPGIVTEVLSIDIYKTGLYYFKLNSSAALSQVLSVLSIIIISLYARVLAARKK